MPLYEYHCNGCGRNFEVLQKFSDPEISICSECGGAVEKMLSAPAIQFKGSGWYVTDYARNGSSGASARSETKTESAEKSSKPENSSKKEGDSSSSKSETKVA